MVRHALIDRDHDGKIYFPASLIYHDFICDRELIIYFVLTISLLYILGKVRQARFKLVVLVSDITLVCLNMCRLAFIASKAHSCLPVQPDIYLILM